MDDETQEKIAALEQQRRILQRRINQREQQAAAYGIDIPPNVQADLNEARDEIRRVIDSINQLQFSTGLGTLNAVVVEPLVSRQPHIQPQTLTDYMQSIVASNERMREDLQRQIVAVQLSQAEDRAREHEQTRRELGQLIRYEHEQIVRHRWWLIALAVIIALLLIAVAWLIGKLL